MNASLLFCLAKIKNTDVSWCFFVLWHPEGDENSTAACRKKGAGGTLFSARVESLKAQIGNKTVFVSHHLDIRDHLAYNLYQYKNSGGRYYANARNVI